MNQTVSAERLHIALFGKRNAGKSSLINALTGQDLALVSDVKGTTTDPVKKAMELLPLGPVVLIDTPGFDDSGELGEKRVQKTEEVLSKTDIALLVSEGTSPDAAEQAFAEKLQKRNIPYIIVFNKADRLAVLPQATDREIYVSALTGTGIYELKERLGKLARDKGTPRRPVADLLQSGDTVVLVVPIDASAPKGRIILPQQQTLRDILDAGCSAVVCQPEQLTATLDNLNKPPRMVITDSQVFGKVAPLVPEEIPLTSFSILFARYKGDLLTQVKGASVLTTLSQGDKVLISEGCTHHRQCGDIGTEKLPRWISAVAEGTPEFSFTSGGTFPTDLSEYKLVVHCGGCMLTETEMRYRLQSAAEAGVAVVNYGVAIAHIHGLLARSLELFPDALVLLRQ
ncbi:MAG: [Clostridia bacterium]|nr:[FeFe] hydrogenase H-cluster maturation GTPase HydF [Clostridia bacterium]